MPNKTDTIKKQIFNKEPDEPLTADEQDILDEIIVSEEPQEVNIDLNDPLFISAFELYLNSKNDSLTSREKFAREIGLVQTNVHQINEPKPLYKSHRMLWWASA